MAKSCFEEDALLKLKKSERDSRKRGETAPAVKRSNEEGGSRVTGDGAKKMGDEVKELLKRMERNIKGSRVEWNGRTVRRWVCGGKRNNRKLGLIKGKKD